MSQGQKTTRGVLSEGRACAGELEGDGAAGAPAGVCEHEACRVDAVETKHAHRRIQTGLLLDLARIQARYHRLVVGRFAREQLDITPSQAQALLVLLEADQALSAQELARELGMSKVTVGRFVRGLIERGWVERSRDPTDQRRYHLRPTDQTRQALPRFVRLSNASMDQLFEGLQRDEIEQLGAWLGRIRTNISRV